MKNAWDDLKSFITISMIVLLYIVTISNIRGHNLDENLLLIITNLITSVFTYYFTRKKNNDNDTEKEDE